MVLAGCAAPGAAPSPEPSPEVSPEPAQTLDREVTIRPRGFHEANLRLAANETIAYRWNASHAIAWDLHSHEGREVKTWAQGNEKQAEGSFVAPIDGIYSLYFHHAQPYPIHVTYHVAGDFVVDSIV